MKINLVMERDKLKLIIRNMELLLDSLKAEVYSDVDAYKRTNYEEHVGVLPDYDEVFEDDE